MSKLYWKLRQSMAMKRHRVLYVVTNLNRNRLKIGSRRLRTYPTNKWGVGWHLRKKERQ